MDIADVKRILKPVEDSPVNEKAQAEQRQTVREIWQNETGHILFSKIGPYLIFDTDLSCLKPGNELECQVINAYIYQLIAKNKTSKRSFLVDSYSMTQIWEGNAPRMRRIDVTDFEVLLGAVNESHHWTLLAIYPGQKSVVYLNPLGEKLSQQQKSQNAARLFLRQNGINVSRVVHLAVDHPNQKDAVSCGVFVCKFAEYLLKEEKIAFDNSTESINKMRMETAETILTESENIDNVCRQCASETSVEKIRNEKWVACDTCNFWFHLNCIDASKRPENIETTSFLCQKCENIK